MIQKKGRLLEPVQVCWTQKMGGVTLRYTAQSTGTVSLVRDEADSGLIAQWTLPAAKASRELLLPFPKPVAGEHRLYFCLEDGISLERWQFHPATQVVVEQNPLTGMDFPDADVIRVGDTYYMISTTMHFMPGGVILRSYDLIHWEYCARVYDVLEDTPRQRLEEGNAYGAGMWAATLRYHKGTFYVIFVANDTRRTYLYRAEHIEGPWRKSTIEGFYHDCSLLFDDDDRAYLVYGQRRIHLLELNDDLTAPKPGGLCRVIADSGQSRYLGYEGSHFYKMNGKYYLFVIHSSKERWRRIESCLISESLTGEFSGGVVLDDDMGLTDAGVAQGGIVDTPDGRWYAVLFQDMGAVGRVPVLMPMAWEGDAPVLGLDGSVPQKICNLTTRPGHQYRPLWSGDDFIDNRLAQAWEWNHIPQLNLTHCGDGQLRIRTCRTAASLTQVQNILTQRAVLPACAAEVTLDASGLQSGDRAGLCVLQRCWGLIGLAKETAGYRLVLYSREKDDDEPGVERISLPWRQSSVRLRLEMHFAAHGDYALFFYQTTDGWQQLGAPHQLYFLLEHFTGNRFGLVVQSTEQPGGEAAFAHFELSLLDM